MFTDEDKTTYKSTYQILKDIAAIYHELTDKDQAALLEKLAGKRGGQVLAGLLNDFSEVDRAMSEIEQAAGSADAEMSIIQESLDYKLNALSQTWVETWQNLIDRGDVGEVIDLLTSFSEGIGSVIDKLGVLGTLSIGGGIFAAFEKKDRGEMHPFNLISFKCVLTTYSTVM